MLAQLKKSLSECHTEKNDQFMKFLADTNIDYLIQRAKEELSKDITRDSLKRVIQILNMARHKIPVVKSERKLSNRELTYKFIELPHVKQLEIACNLGLWHINEKEDDDQKRNITIFERANEQSKLIDLERKVLEAHNESLSS